MVTILVLIFTVKFLTFLALPLYILFANSFFSRIFLIEFLFDEQYSLMYPLKSISFFFEYFLYLFVISFVFFAKSFLLFTIFFGIGIFLINIVKPLDAFNPKFEDIFL